MLSGFFCIMAFHGPLLSCKEISMWAFDERHHVVIAGFHVSVCAEGFRGVVTAICKLFE